MNRLVFAACGIAILLTTVATADTPPLAEAPFDAQQAHACQDQWAEHLGRERNITNSIGMPLVLLPPGEFTMGRTEEEFDRLLEVIDSDPELRKNRGGMVTWSMLMMPAHRVRLTKPFYMGATEVTVGQFRAFVEESGYVTEAEQGLNHGAPYQGGRPMSTWRRPMAWRPGYQQQDDEPVLHLCWNDCVAFCEWLSEKERIEYHLPTEAQWEYACRAGTTTPWSFGGYEEFDQVSDYYAWWSDGGQGSHDRPRSVAQGRPNAFGLYDMHGNVWEYVGDWWHRLYYKESPLNDPAGPAQQSEKNDMRRIIRGSSFDWGRWGGDSAYRMRITQRSNQHPHMGFRVAATIEDADGAPPAVDPQLELRSTVRDPGAGSEEVAAALAVGGSGDDQPAELTVDLGGDVKMEFVLISAGSFLMGSDQGDRDELPLHRVVISRPFYMAKYELTQAQWEAVMGPDQRLAELRSADNEMAGPTKAMNALSWETCQTLISRLRELAPQHRFALPTEAQWEYACRAGSTTAFHFGDDESLLGDYAWYAGNMIWPGQPAFAGKAHYHNVGVKQPNAWGLYDMHGGVWEWCADWYDADDYITAPLGDPQGPQTGRFRVLRGGSWFRYGKYARSAYRRFFHPEGDSDGVTAWILDFGCRPVINLDPAQTASSAGTTDSTSLLTLAQNLVKRESNPVLDAGRTGEWDDGRCGCFSVCEVDGRLHLYYMGAGSGNPWRIGLATSSDGLHWQRSPSNPVLTQGAPGSWDDRQVSMPCVLHDDGAFWMWYCGSGHGGGFGLARSEDGVNWTRQGPGPVMRGVGGSMDPCVRKFGDEFVMWYCGRVGDSYRLLRATSNDGVHWRKELEPVLPLGDEDAFDSRHHAGPCVVKAGDGYLLFHLGSNGRKWTLGAAQSIDGIDWRQVSSEPLLDVGGPEDWDGGSILGFDVLLRDGRLDVWYAAHSLADAGRPEEEQTIRIGYAASR